jgi:acyl-CoA reductase-like NAD-dependent aldehyde dehydrogenase
MAVTSSISIVRQPATPATAIDRAIAELQVGAGRLAASSLVERINWASACIDAVSNVAQDWVEAACRAKRIPASSPARAEEVLVGPVSVVRYLRMMVRTLSDLRTGSVPRLPGKPYLVRGQVRVPTFPTRELYDALIFRPMTAETWLQPDVSPAAIFGDAADRLARRSKASPRIALVLGAGNVSAIPATDALTRILQNDCAVLLKMNPVNDYLGPFFEQSLQPLIQAGFLRIVYGGAEEGRYAVNHAQIDTVHITGSTDTHDAIVWGRDSEQRRQRKLAGQPVVTKPVTSELGNVTPWAIVPGDYSDAQLVSQAESIAASITNNASFNCIATKVLITWKRWPAREHFLDLISSILERTPPRYAYYPGAAERFAEFSGGGNGPDDQGRLPWVLRRGVDRESEPHLFERESFVCATGETAIDADSPEEFLDRAVQFMNDRTWGALAAGLTVPDSLRKKNAAGLAAAVGRLRFGAVGINQWPGLAFALMSPPWGAYPGADLSSVQSGMGFVHNTYLLDRPQKTVLHAPLSLFPKPVWFSTHRRPEAVAWKLFALYCRPSLLKIPGVLSQALRG